MRKIVSLRLDDKILQLLDQFISINTRCFQYKMNRTELVTEALTIGLSELIKQSPLLMDCVIVDEKGKKIEIDEENRNNMRELEQTVLEYYVENYLGGK